MRPRPVELAAGLPLAAAAGFVVGVLASFKAESGVDSGVPYGLVLGVLLAGVFVAALRAGFRTRWFAAAAGLGLVAAVGVLALPSRGGSTVVDLADPATDPTGVLWLVLSAVLVLLVVVPPMPRGRRSPPAASGRLDDDDDDDEGTRP